MLRPTALRPASERSREAGACFPELTASDESSRSDAFLQAVPSTLPRQHRGLKRKLAAEERQFARLNWGWSERRVRCPRRFRRACRLLPGNAVPPRCSARAALRSLRLCQLLSEDRDQANAIGHRTIIGFRDFKHGTAGHRRGNFPDNLDAIGDRLAYIAFTVTPVSEQDIDV